jgi:hypothetical protein
MQFKEQQESRFYKFINVKNGSRFINSKTTQGGISGLLDVTGQALGPTVETAIILANQQNQFGSIFSFRSN